MASELPRDTGLAGSGHWPHTGPPSGTGLSWGHKRRAPAPPAGCHAQQRDTALLQPHQDLAALSTQASPRAWTQQAVSSLGKARGLLSLSAPTTSSSTVSLPSLRVYFQPHCYPPAMCLTLRAVPSPHVPTPLLQTLRAKWLLHKTLISR